jgi:DNA replication initiation complex subunit (GINS family)
MADITITYDVLYEILRLEKTRKELQELDKNFFKNLLSYLKEKHEILDTQQKENNIFSKEFEKTQKQIQNIKKMLKELYERRESKIIQLAVYASRTQQKPNSDGLLKEEKEFLTSITKNLNNYRGDILYNLLKNKIPEIKQEEIITTAPKLTNTLIKFTHALPQFVGDDLNTYGPFEEEDVANIPEKVAQVLLTRKKAKEIKA